MTVDVCDGEISDILPITSSTVSFFLLIKNNSGGPLCSSTFLLEDRAKVLHGKQLALQKLQEKKFREKQLTEEIMVYGLWQNESQVTSALEKMRSNTEKLKALKCQLDFRAIVFF